MSAQPAATQSGILGLIEKVGNKAPHPVVMFLYLIIGVIVLSAILNLLGVSVTKKWRCRYRWILSSTCTKIARRRAITIRHNPTMNNLRSKKRRFLFAVS